MATGQQFTGAPAAGPPRPAYVYTIPASLKNDEFPHESVSLQLLTCDEELNASRLGSYDVLKTQYEAAKLAIAEIDGKPANQANGDVDIFWEKGGPKMRSLILQAYGKISAPDKEEEKSFFGSLKVKLA